MNLVTAEHLTKSYTERLLFDDTDFSINEGDKIGLIGINGTGKSTLLKMVAGLEEPDSGRIVRGRNLDIRYLPQNPVFHPGETVLESVLRENEGHEHVWDLESQAKSMLNRLGIPDFNEKVEHLSGGQKKRAALASVLLSTAELLILDEPTSGMDPRARVEFKELLKELCAEGKTILVSSHILSELAQMCTDIGIIDAGKIVLSGNMGDILKQVNDSNPIRVQVVENVREAVQFLRAEPEVRTITVEGNDLVVGFHGGKDAEAMLLAKLVAHNIGICGFWREPGDLESIFMQITDHDMEKVVMTSEE